MTCITKNNTDSMVALHLANETVGDWSRNMAQHYKMIKAPILVASKKAVGYSTSWKHKPLSSSQTFTLFKCIVAPAPTHNAWLLQELNPKSDFRSYWSDVALLPSTEYNKTKSEIRMMVGGCS